ncbi:hypothetical protein TNCV_1180831 [Trichonephila clavipes]|nr:hypothetical protein TNCV_1180831 [Trichonephila clavipes]
MRLANQRLHFARDEVSDWLGISTQQPWCEFSFTKRHSLIQKVFVNYKSTKILTPKPRSDRPSAVSSQESCFVTRSIKINPRLYASQIANSVC